VKDTEVKHLDDQPDSRPATTTTAPQAPDAAGRLLPPSREVGPMSGAANCRPLAELLDRVAHIDRLQAEIVGLVGRLQVSGEDVEQTGLPAELWLTVEGRMASSDRRMLGSVAEHLGRLPATAREFACGGLSWSQCRTIIMMLIRHRVRSDEWEAVDAAIADAVGRAAADDPDEVLRLIDDWLWRRHPDKLEADEADQSQRRYLALQPRLDGLGGRFHGETDAPGLALLETATRPSPDQLATPDPDPGPDRERDRDGDRVDGLTPVGRAGRARHDNLMARLAATGHHRQTDPDTSANHGDTQSGSRLPDPSVLVTIDYDTLVGLSNSYAQLLAGLAGGRLKVSAPTARRLVGDGFDGRLIVLDTTGQVLGVGRRRRQPPGWLRDALAARDTTCSFPGCRTAGVVCQADHATPWIAGGATDINNLALVCGPHNRAKEPDGWKAVGHPDGSRTWQHPRTGLTARTGPATLRLPEHPPDRPPTSPTGHDPP